MYKISPACFWQVLILFYICPSISPAEDIDNLVQTGKAIINSYANRLQDEYGSTFHQGKYAWVGDVCKKNTPTLTINGWQIKRISLSTINQINDTDAVDTRILEDFKLKYDAGWSLERLAYYKLDETENYKQFRYYKAFEYEQRCLSCHGNNEGDNFLKPDLGAYAIIKIVDQAVSEPSHTFRESPLPAYNDSGDFPR